ncbi:MAG: hypothetical protein RR454_01835 [Clostridia bacterium]
MEGVFALVFPVMALFVFGIVGFFIFIIIKEAKINKGKSEVVQQNVQKIAPTSPQIRKESGQTQTEEVFGSFSAHGLDVRKREGSCLSAKNDFEKEIFKIEKAEYEKEKLLKDKLQKKRDDRTQREKDEKNAKALENENLAQKQEEHLKELRKFVIYSEILGEPKFKNRSKLQ